ncbi:hypothetical protein [Nocardia anaemiae]|uniref:hypothetical protein n=1 Tax=Nocardia anaemiae TaxID=263910 RepID=UPI000A49C345|nr:hypothetical protein [Nocardia anaemiae]
MEAWIDKRFDAVLREMAKGADGVTLIDITRAAGWGDGWSGWWGVRVPTEVDDLDKND